MEKGYILVSSKTSKNIYLKVIPGHFATNHSHINQFIDLTSVKSKLNEAGEVARHMAFPFRSSTLVDTIVCLDKCEVVGGFIAKELTCNIGWSMNAGQEIHVISPEYGSNGQIIFTDNLQSLIREKNILLVVASATTGDSIRRVIKAIEYYGGTVSGLSAIFTAVKEVDSLPVHAIFHATDLPDYQSYLPQECPLCKRGDKLEGIVNGCGYMRL